LAPAHQTNCGSRHRGPGDRVGNCFRYFSAASRAKRTRLRHDGGEAYRCIALNARVGRRRGRNRHPFARRDREGTNDRPSLGRSAGGNAGYAGVNAMKRLLGFVMPLLLAAQICAPSAFSQQPPAEKTWPSPKAAAAPVAGSQAAPQSPSKGDLELKRQEMEGIYNATKETLSAVIQQLAAAGSDLSPQERRQLEIEEAKLRPQLKSYEEQLKLINQRLSQSSPGADAAAPVAATPVAAGVEANPDETQIKVLALRNARATDAERIIRQLFGNDLHSIASDARTNSLIIRGPAAETNIVYHLMVRLDEQSETPVPSATRSTTESKSAAPTKASANLTGQYEAKEQEAARLPQTIRELQTAPKEHEWAIKDLSAQLRRAVTEAFASRQQLHQAEVGQLQARIAGIQQALKMRDKLSNEIIDKRVKDLLNPDLQWEGTDAGTSKTAATTATASTASTASAQPPKVTY